MSKRPSLPDLRVGVDLGGTKIHACAISPKGKVKGQARLPTAPRDGYPSVVGRIADAARAAVADAGGRWRDVEAVGVGVCGACDPDKGEVILAPNLAWRGRRLAADLAHRCRRPVAIGNDVNLGALGESVHGAAVDRASAFAVFVGTGLGGGLVIDGAVVNGAHGFAGEIGHFPAPFGDALCGCGRRGCLETVASKSGLARLVREAVRSGIPHRIDLKLLHKSSAYRAALLAGCPATRQAVDACTRALAWGMAVAGHAADPRCFVLGGGVIEAIGGAMLPTLRRSLPEISSFYARRRPELLLAALGDDAVAVGAAVLSMEAA